MNDEERQAAFAAEMDCDDAYKEKVLRSFLRDGQLTSIPAQLKKKLIAYQHIAEAFEPGREYSEGQVKAVLLGFHPDFCTLRRGLVDAGFLTRENNIYKRAEQ